MAWNSVFFVLSDMLSCVLVVRKILMVLMWSSWSGDWMKRSVHKGGYVCMWDMTDGLVENGEEWVKEDCKEYWG